MSLSETEFEYDLFNHLIKTCEGYKSLYQNKNYYLFKYKIFRKTDFKLLNS